MQLKDEEKDKIIEIAKGYGAKKIWLFGSALESSPEPNDIDIAVEGIPPEKFFDLYAALDMQITSDIDLVDMDSNPPISVIIRKKGSVIYAG